MKKRRVKHTKIHKFNKNELHGKLLYFLARTLRPFALAAHDRPESGTQWLSLLVLCRYACQGSPVPSISIPLDDGDFVLLIINCFGGSFSQQTIYVSRTIYNNVRTHTFLSTEKYYSRFYLRFFFNSINYVLTIKIKIRSIELFGVMSSAGARAAHFSAPY